MSIQLGAKRSYIPGEENAPALPPLGSKRRRLAIQKGFFVQRISPYSLSDKNVVWLNPQDHANFFSHTKTASPHYIQIADKIFRTEISSLEIGHIGMTKDQIHSAADGVYQIKGDRRVTANPFFPSDYVPYPIQKLQIKIYDEKGPLHDEGQRVYLLDEIKTQVRNILENEIITPNATLLLDLRNGPVGIIINSIHPVRRIQHAQRSFGMMLPDTELKIIHSLSEDAVIVDKVFRDEIERMEFHISISQRSKNTNSDILPLPISKEEIIQEIIKQFEEQVIAQGADYTIQHQSGWDITATFKTGVLQSKFINFQEENINCYSNGFVLTKRTPINIKADRNILLTEGKPQLAKNMTIKVVDIPGGQTVTIDHDKQRWLSLKELKEALYKLNRPLAVKEKFEVSLSSGRFLLEVRKAHESENAEEIHSSKTEPLWLIDPSTLINIVSEKELSLNMLRDQGVYPYKRTTIQITAERIPDDGLIAPLDQLKELAVNQSPVRLVKNHRFSVVTKDRDRLEFKILRTIFDESVGATKDISVFGAITPETEIDFSTSLKESLTLVENIHSANIKAMRFSIHAYRHPDVIKYQQAPIIMNRSDLTKLIREELAKHPFVTQGFKTTIQLENGWCVKATFRKGILERDASRKTITGIKSTSVIKDGFAMISDTEVELVGGGEFIILTQGDPVLAGSMHFKICKLEEDFTTLDTSVKKGAWINIEELKSALLALDKHFSGKEKILIELESGRYLLEVKGAKLFDPQASQPKKRRETVWKISDETKIHVTVDQGIDLITVENGALYPLKKIKFITSPENDQDEHFSIAEDELRTVLKEELPDRLIQGQTLTLETKDGYSVLVNVDEITLEDELPSLNKKKIFTKITEETEIIFRGKEKTPLAIRSEPKILEVDDPIKYLASLGMAGIEKEFEQISRIFFSRSERLTAEARRRGTKPVKGILLYGPPGTGKTTLARNLGEMLGCSGERLQLITATEVFNMWFGQSEENIRKLFTPAKNAQKNLGNKSPLYVVVVDEIDALLPPRGGSTGKVRDSLVNQFLGAIDGLSELNNLMVIGLTNRKDEIDPAALRHGRLGVHIKMDLPDRKARLAIFEVHTKKLVKEGILHDNVNFEELADRTDKQPGATIEGIVKSATLFSLERLSKLKCTKEELKTHPDGMVTMEDFNKAMTEQLKKKEIPESVHHIYT